MTSISFMAEFDDEGARAKLAALVERMDRPIGFYKNVGEHLVGSTGDNFKAEAGPDGVPWQKLMPATIKARERAGLTPIQILRARGRLRGSINAAASDEDVRIGSASPYAAIHQFGGEIQRPSRQGKIFRKRTEDGKPGRLFVKRAEADMETDVMIPAHTIKIPARPFLGLSKLDEDIIIEIAEDWLLSE